MVKLECSVDVHRRTFPHLLVVLFPGLGVVRLSCARSRLTLVSSSGCSRLDPGRLSGHGTSSRLLVVLRVICRPGCVRISRCFTLKRRNTLLTSAANPLTTHNFHSSSTYSSAYWDHAAATAGMSSPNPEDTGHQEDHHWRKRQ